MTVAYSGGDGLTKETAVVIAAENSGVGVKAEYQWLGEHYPGYQMTIQRLLRGDAGQMYDKIEFTMPDGQTLAIYFDITGFFGKF